MMSGQHTTTGGSWDVVVHQPGGIYKLICAFYSLRSSSSSDWMDSQTMERLLSLEFCNKMGGIK